MTLAIIIFVGACGFLVNLACFHNGLQRGHTQVQIISGIGMTLMVVITVLSLSTL